MLQRDGRVDLAGRTRQYGSAPRGWCRSCSEPSPRCATRSRPIDAPARIVVQSSLVANEPVPGRADDPRAAAALRAPLVGEYHIHHDLEVGARAPHAPQRPAHRGRDGPCRRRPTGTVTAVRERARSRPVTVSTELEPGRVARRREVARVRVVGRALDARTARPGRCGARGGEALRLGGSGRAAEGVSRRGLGPCRHRDRRRRRAAAGGAVRALPSGAGGRARRAASDPRQGPHRAAATTATRSGIPRRTRCRC